MKRFAVIMTVIILVIMVGCSSNEREPQKEEGHQDIPFARVVDFLGISDNKESKIYELIRYLDKRDGKFDITSLYKEGSEKPVGYAIVWQESFDTHGKTNEETKIIRGKLDELYGEPEVSSGSFVTTRSWADNESNMRISNSTSDDVRPDINLLIQLQD